MAGLYYVPAIDQHREASIISVTRNGGNSEAFHVKVPVDRIMIGASGQANPLPTGMVWPDDPKFSGTRVELFKLRNARDAVVGVASRLATDDPALGNLVEWTLHLPARGSVLFNIAPQTVNGDSRVGDLRAGTREFSTLVGGMSERWVAEASNSAGSPTGRIELLMTFVSNVIRSDDGELAE